jgi:hypothetical protein
MLGHTKVFTQISLFVKILGSFDVNHAPIQPFSTRTGPGHLGEISSY